MTDVEIYNLAGWLGDHKTLFHLFDRKSPELDYELFSQDLLWHYLGGTTFDFYDIGYHLEEVIGAPLEWVRNSNG